MRIDCRNLECPKPVVETKKALCELKDNEILEILLNSTISKNNVLKFLNSLNLYAEIEENDNEFCIKVKKQNIDFSKTNIHEYKVLFLKSDKIGSGELGKNLFVGFLNTLKNIENLPDKILCVNESVLINTDKNHLAYLAMKDLENLGVKIISCGACLEFFKKSNELEIGHIGNAYEILNELFGRAKIISL
ncbi:sulfurtransferase-like selenium metabolism protein YedF [Campylobacter hepaticus]|uniref:Sulfurtransferase-like selenium metabolism protein YedF n=1 Tax=Campylobacter hepaticus TaxID=1813019 RepID=A0A424Z0M5_9BACT|nr:sulfurtransferase-like selenium metabolism protein YedF [Campylobacter hepaticus]AXP08868.1 sulfurtransferase-like selenium metabolism protein YedF [Campylobacter hepaticus]MCZ0771846.1 sulfurtransferase-like selenium metabolism protein YedF [Campylobacter hepaticus]MCZ0773287.1 sulfurtransferase-like selenium metabolism protein YedF [Campylobacter hepaticus]MCZ0774538.1 sulfurtransferase-like selenium metabolism protein YedF [Campylobacter hepaticus]MDX2323852.1 sulfurtransferase-like sele